MSIVYVSLFLDLMPLKAKSNKCFGFNGQIAVPLHRIPKIGSPATMSINCKN